MTHDETEKALHQVRPGAKWSMRDGNITLWEGPGVQPTEVELEAGLVALAALEYRDKRRDAYPPIGDQLDALFAGGTDLADMKILLQSVKDRFPKP